MRTATIPVSARMSILCVLALFILSTAPVSAQEELVGGPGMDWEKPAYTQLFINGTEGDAALSRDIPRGTNEPQGFKRMTKTGQITDNEIMVTSLPAEETVQITGNVTVRLFASLETAHLYCRSQNVLPGTPLGGDTQFFITLRVGGQVVLDGEPTESIALERDWLNPHNFSVRSEINATLAYGENIELSVQYRHECGFEGRLWWGTYDLASGIIFETDDIFTPELDALVDENGVLRVEYTPISAFGPSDYSRVRIDIGGPYGDWFEAVHGNLPEDEHIEHMETPADGERMVEGNRTAWTWVANRTLTPGIHMVDICVDTRDGDFNDDCHIIGVRRFMVEAPPDPWLNSGWFAAAGSLSTLGLLGFMARTRFPPWPVLVVMGLLLAASFGAIGALPDIAPSEMREEGAAPDFTLLAHGGGSVSLSDLRDGHDAVAIGVFTVGSPAANVQADDFRNAIEDLEGRVAFVQIMTGDGAEMIDADAHAAEVNKSWPILIDESSSAIAKQLPTGAGDGVVIVDAAGFIVAWQPTSASDRAIEAYADNAASGGDRSIFELLTWGALSVLLPLLVLGFPTRKIEPPEDVLIPGAGWIGTMGAASLGFAIHAVPMALLAIIVGGALWTWVELLFIIWFGVQAVMMLWRNALPEVDALATIVHGKLPVAYRKWRDADWFRWDVRMGHWLAWLTWIALPTMVPQMVASRVAAGGIGLLTGPLSLVLVIAVAGLIALLFRIASAFGGPLSRLAGGLSAPVMVRAWGALCAALAAWMAMWVIIGPAWALVWH